MRAAYFKLMCGYCAMRKTFCVQLLFFWFSRSRSHSSLSIGSQECFACSWQSSRLHHLMAFYRPNHVLSKCNRIFSHEKCKNYQNNVTNTACFNTSTIQWLAKCNRIPNGLIPEKKVEVFLLDFCVFEKRN